MRSRFILIVLLFKLITIATNAQPQPALAGEYYLEGVMETASGFLLRPDSSFEFFFSQGALDRTGKGQWKLRNGKLVLQTEPWPGLDFKLDSTSSTPADNVLLQVVEKNKQLLPFVDVMLVKGELVRDASLNQEGVARFPAIAPDTILLQFRFCPERFSSFAVKDTAINRFVFSFQPWVFDVFFTEFELEIIPAGLAGNHPILMGKRFVYKRSSAE